MSKRILVAAAIFALGAADTASAEAVYTGVIRTIATTPECQYYSVGRLDNSQFHPSIAGNAAFSAISFLQPYSAVGYQLSNNDFDQFFRPVVSGGVGWGNPFSWTGSKVRIINQVPDTITASTPGVFLKGQIMKPEDDPGGQACIITFTASYVLRPF